MATNSSDNEKPESSHEEVTARVGSTVAASWSVTLEDLRANINHEPADVQELLVWCYLWCTDPAHPIRREEFASHVGYHHTTILKIVRGTYRHPESGERQLVDEKFVTAMQAFREREIERAQANRPKYIKTPTLLRIWTACELARESQSPVFIIGPSHIGKTVALISYKEEHNHGRTVYVRLKAASGLGGMIKAIAEGIGGIGLKANTATLIDSIKRKLTPNMVLILDEVHELIYTYRKESFFACLEVIREIYDATNCGLVLCGTTLLMKRVKDNRGELEQMLRRGVHKTILPEQPTKADLTAILKAYDLPFPARELRLNVRVDSQTIMEQPYEILRQVGKEEGLKAIVERLRYGSKRAKKQHQTLTWDHVCWAHLKIKAQEVPGDDWN
jgi:DNA transposition AAA+ family ATPase